MTMLGWCRRLASWLVAGACLAALVVGVLLPRVAGATPYTVLTSSMTPQLPPGTLVVVRPVDPEQIGTNTVVTYQLRSGRPEVVTHRVVALRTDLTGQLEYQTQGDANDTPDAAWVRPEQIRGELWYAVPHLGRASTWLSPAHRAQLVQVVAGLLMLYAAAMFARSLAGGRRKATPVESGHLLEELSA